MARGGAYLRNISKLNVLFGVGSLLLFAALLVMIADDTVREWKRYQREFNRLEVQKTKEQLESADAKVDKEKLTQLTRQIEEAEKKIAGQKDQIDAVQKELKQLEAKIYKTNQEYQFTRSYLSVAKYEYEEAVQHGDEKEVREWKEKLDHETAKETQFKKELDQLALDKQEKEDRVAAIQSEKVALKEKVNALLKGKARFEKKLKNIKPGFRSWILNLPMLDFIAPTRKIKQVVVEDLKEDYHFTKVPRVDRCMTCHMGIDKEGWEDVKQPFKTHPRLDLFVASTSPHPMNEFGCTVCHGGSGQAVTFFDTAHTPDSEEQKKEWEEKYNWKPQKFVEEKMLPASLIESSCLQCHNDGNPITIKDAPKLTKGKELFEDRGCYSCHAVEGYEDFRKLGPDLSRIAGKTNKDWAAKWLKAPLAFRPDTKMPQFFDLSNTSLPEDIKKNNAEIAGIVDYLYKKSGDFEVPQTYQGGDAQKGKELVANLGCMACHAVEDWEGTDFGPDLNSIGSKVDPSWLADWVKNPKHYWKETRMPSLRISDDEANDITAYLMTLKNEPFEKMAVPEAEPAVVDEMVYDYLVSQHGTVMAKQKLDAMSEDEKRLYLGQRAINHYGCAGCHNIPGFEKAGKIGVELTEEGSKDPHTLDFGNIHIEHTRQDWFKTKMKNPRVFDKGKVKGRLEKLKMPNFHFDDEEAEALTVYLLSLKKSEIPSDMKELLDERGKAIVEGRRMVNDFNCQACHLIEGKGGIIKETLADGMAPPSLNTEGAKVWGDWLHSFLKTPSTLRPWLQIRMPTYGFSDKEATELVKYFNAVDNQKFTYKSKEDQIPKPSKEQWEVGKQIFDQFRCVQCHQAENIEDRNPLELAPDLGLARERLKPRWIVKWLVDPNRIMPGTRMPGYWPDFQSPLPDVLGGSAKKQIIAIRNYLVNMDLYEESKSSKNDDKIGPKSNFTTGRRK